MRVRVIDHEIYNEDVNAARLALQAAVNDFREWSVAWSPEQMAALFITVIELEGLDRPINHDMALYDGVRKRFG